MVSGDPDAWRRYAEGQRLESEGREDEALEAYQRALAADPEFPLAHVRLAGRLLWRDREAVRRHLDAARRGLDRVPLRERVLFDARAASLKFRNEDAIAAYDRAIAGWPQDPTAYFEVGFLVHGSMYDPAQARPYLEKALELGGLGVRERHWAEIFLGRLDQALEHARAAAAASPDRSTFTRLSQVHRLRGETREALEAARRAIAGDDRPLHPRQFWAFVEADALDELEAEMRRRGEVPLAAAGPQATRLWEVLVLRGQHRAARVAIDASRPPRDAPPVAQSLYRALRASSLAGNGNVDGVWREVVGMLVGGGSVAVCYTIPLMALGDVDRADRLASLWRMDERFSPYCMTLYRHLRAWRTGDPEGAVRGLSAMFGAEPTYMRGAILAEMGRDREAVEAFRRFRSRTRRGRQLRRRQRLRIPAHALPRGQLPRAARRRRRRAPGGRAAAPDVAPRRSRPPAAPRGEGAAAAARGQARGLIRAQAFRSRGHEGGSQRPRAARCSSALATPPRSSS